MATLRQYFETDINYTLKVHIKKDYLGSPVSGVMHIDVPGNTTFMSWYIEGKNKTADFFLNFLKQFEYGKSTFQVAGGVTLPSAKTCACDFKFDNGNTFGIEYQMYGDSTWRSAHTIVMSRRVFIYSETDFGSDAIFKLQADAEELGHFLQFRCKTYTHRMDSMSRPAAFICHDSRDKDIARAIAINLQSRRCSVWYDEFSLMVGDNLRESIEKGLKECKKCVLILSPNFFNNQGWTKKEFDSIFTREIIEERSLVLPVWRDVGKSEVYGYSPSLLNILGLDWNGLGDDEVSRQLHLAIEKE